jgi:hydroxymethylglutaryl-CoA lyase
MRLRGQLAQWLAGEALHGHIWRAGLPKTLKAATAEGVAA